MEKSFCMHCADNRTKRQSFLPAILCFLALKQQTKINCRERIFVFFFCLFRIG